MTEASGQIGGLQIKTGLTQGIEPDPQGERGLRLSPRELPLEVPAATARPALDQALDSPRNPVPPSPGIPLLLGLGVDYRKSSSISLTTVLDTSIIAFTLCWSPS